MLIVCLFRGDPEQILEEFAMNVVKSDDGTKIAYDREGRGPALVLVDGAMCTRSTGSKPELTNLLAAHFTVYSYDRRGRGDSGDTQPYAVGREVEDIAALVDDAGGTACLYGHSSGACLALLAAVQLGARITRLAMYEAPYHTDPDTQRAWSAYIGELTETLAAGRFGDAVALFMTYVGMPAEQLATMRQSPFWPAMETLAPTLAYDHAAILGKHASVPVERAARLAAPALVMHGGASFPFMADAARSVSRAIPRAQLRMLPGQGHDVNPRILTQALAEFFLA